MVATAIVDSTNARVPIRLINLAGNDVTLYKGTKVAEAAVVDHPLPISEICESHMEPAVRGKAVSSVDSSREYI